MKTNMRRCGSGLFHRPVITAAVAFIAMAPGIVGAAQPRAGIANVGWMAGPVAQYQCLRREVAGLSNSVAALGTALQQESDRIRLTLRDVEAIQLQHLVSVESDRLLGEQGLLATANYAARLEAWPSPVMQKGETGFGHSPAGIGLPAIASLFGALALIAVCVLRSGRMGDAIRLLISDHASAAKASDDGRPGSESGFRAFPPCQAHPAPLAGNGPSQTTDPVAIPTGEALLKLLIEPIRATSGSEATLSILTRSPTVAAESAQGNVRSENQDYVLGFSMGHCDVAVVADGCGGTDHGAAASFLAVKAAASFLMRGFSEQRAFDPVTAVRQALFHASDALANVSVAVPALSTGLRTTLIVILADAKRFAFAYIGDGGGVIVRQSGNVEKFLFPQKADETASNVIAASLGPQMFGEPVSGAVPRYAGDLLITGTDGLWDRVGAGFPLAVAQSVSLHGGDLHSAAASAIAQLADCRDEYGYVCDDNLSMCLIADSIRSAMPPIGPSASAPSPLGESATKQEADDDQA